MSFSGFSGTIQFFYTNSVIVIYIRKRCTCELYHCSRTQSLTGFQKKKKSQKYQPHSFLRS